MIQLNRALLDDLGLGSLTDEAKDSLLEHVYDKLEINVGTIIASKLSDTQLKEFEGLIDNNQQQQALAWLQANYPDYKKVVELEMERLVSELKSNATDILKVDQVPDDEAET